MPPSRAEAPSGTGRWNVRGTRRAVRQGEAGAALIVGMVFLLILTILGLTSMRATTLEERMAGNHYDRQIALQAAELALREAETWLSHNRDPFLHHDCAGGLCSNPRYQSVSGWQTDPEHAVWSSARVALERPPNTAAAARYVIEDMCESSSSPTALPDSQRTFRITAVGFGGSPEARVVLQSSFVTENKYGVAGACNCAHTSYCSSCRMTCSP